MLRKSYSVFKKKQMGKLTIFSIWRNSSVVISPGHFLRLLHMSRGIVWVDRDNPHGAPKVAGSLYDPQTESRDPRRKSQDVSILGAPCVPHASA